MRFFWQRAWQYKGLTSGLIISVVLAILVFQFLPPLIVAGVIDRLSRGDYTQGDLWGSFGNEFLWFIALSVLGGVVLWRIVVVLIWQLEMRVLRDIYQIVFAHLMSQSASFHANNFGGSLVSQANKLASAYIRTADTTVFQLTNLILAFVFTAIILVPRAPELVAGLVIFSILFMLSAVKITKYVRALNAREASFSNKQTGALADAVTNIMAIKAFAATERENARYAQATEDTRLATRDVMVASVKRDIYFSVVTGILPIIALIASAAAIVLHGADIGTMFLVITYIAMISQRLWEFSQSTLRNYNRSLGDAKSMIETLSIVPEVRDPNKPEKSRISKGGIVFKAMSFNHADANQDDSLFKSLNLTIEPGEKIGLVGHSGSGKTTLVRLLLRFADIDSGSIEIDSQNIASITQKDLHESIAFVPQEPLLFHRSLAENIAYGKSDATDKEIRDAAKKAHALEFIEKLPEGFDTLVGERGVKLSGGQRQRIAIARAILKDAPILVLDEATSALDSESERLIQQSLGELMKNRTSIVIAHRLSTIQKMDRIIVLDNGMIAEEGTHTELLKKKGIYASLWKHQSGGFIEE